MEEKGGEGRRGGEEGSRRGQVKGDTHILVLFDNRTAFIDFLRRDSRELFDSASSVPPLKSS